MGSPRWRAALNAPAEDGDAKPDRGWHRLAHVTACSKCSEENPPRARFCLACGTALDAEPARVERKIVSVLFADLVGFTSRSQRLDVEDVSAVLSPYHALLRRELERFGGTVEKFIGDAVMALFGAPVAHEDDAERAVRAALAIRFAIEDLNEQNPGLDLHVRIGVNSGEALIALGARPSVGEGMASGDVVNTCSRLQSAAPIDGILVGEGTYRATQRSIEYREEAAIDAKGKDEPVRGWEALQARASLGVDLGHVGSLPLVAREHELALLRGALARSVRERAPQLVTVVGVPGIGKSRLVWELGRIVDDEPDIYAWRQGRSLSYGDGVAFWALGEIVKAQAGVLESDDAEAAAQKLEQQFATSYRMSARPAGSRASCDLSSASAGLRRRKARASSRPSRPGAASSRRSRSGGRWCWCSRICTGPTTPCSTSSTSSSTA